MKIKSYLLILPLCLFFSYSKAQHSEVSPYTMGLGLRGGFLYGISIKSFIAPRGAIEGILGTRWQGYSLTGLFEYQKRTKKSGLDWFFGFGAHAGTYEERYFIQSSGGKPKSSKTIWAIGVDGIVGIEYMVTKVPVSFGVDFKPFMDLVNSNQNYLDAALTIRYTFK